MVKTGTYHFIFILSIALIWSACANIVSPTGGARDEKAPVIIKRSLVDSALNYKGGKIEFTFNEFVQIKDAQNQFVISPFLKQNPKLTAHKQKVSMIIADSLLLPNTTYHVSLGNAIQDLHESNPYPHLGFTFSTGPYFDSLSIKGNITDAKTGLPDTTAWAILYPAGMPDSTIMKEKPLYAQKAFNGKFNFANLPARDFTIYALTDLNANLKYDLNSERIAFIENTINAKDTAAIIQLYTFAVQARTDTSTKKPRPTANREVAPKNVSGKCIYQILTDTLSKTKRTFDITDSLRIHFDGKIIKMDLTKIRLTQDDVLDATANIILDTIRQMIAIKTEWLPNANYQLQLLKGFAVDSAGMQAAASSCKFKTKMQSDYGSVQIQCIPNGSQLFELMQGDKIIRTAYAMDTLVQFLMLAPGTYTLRALQDKIKNGIWDTGVFGKEKVQPEIRNVLSDNLLIKANWDNRLDIRKRVINK